MTTPNTLYADDQAAPKIPPQTDSEELEHFAAIAHAWWDEDGALASLHHLTPARLAFIKGAIAQGLAWNPLLEGAGSSPLKGLSLLDIGCGGGLLAEPLARLGADVTGLDATPEAVAVARAHAKQSGLSIAYREGTTDSLPASAVYDVVLASEVLEHVTDPEAFLATACAHLKPEGLLIITTVNRTLKSLLLGIVAAEKILKIVPDGLHDWQAFLKPSEVAGMLRSLGLTVGGMSGLRYNPFNRRARLTPHALDINYLLWAKRI